MKIVTGILVVLFFSFSESKTLDGQQPVELKGNNIDEDPDEFNFIDISHLGRSIFGAPDNKTTGPRIAEYKETEIANPEELGSYLEGDMLIPGTSEGRNGLLARSTRWPRGIIPYEIRGSFNAREMALIEQGINEFHVKTCIKFKPRTSERDYVSIVNGKTGCWSSVGRIGGKQEVNLQTPACMTKIGTFLHEMTHALGFLHEQNRYERDSYITIHYENIQSDVQHNFEKASSKSTYGFGISYDYASVMHYSAYAFSTNGKPTITPKKRKVDHAIMGQRDGFSMKDVQKINNMYECE